MQVTLDNTPIEKIAADAAALVAFQDEDAPAGVPASWWQDLKSSEEFTGKAGETAVLAQPAGFAAKRLLLYGGGKRAEFNHHGWRKAAAVVLRALKAKGAKTIAFAVPAGAVAPAAEGALLGSYEPDKNKSKKEAKSADTFLIASPGAAADLLRGTIIGESVNWAREMINEPGNLLPPRVLAERAQAMARQEGLECEVLDRERMKQLGMGALLGVAQGSEEPPFLIVVRYRPENPKSGDHLGLVGKGVTFDTGGVSIKPADGMEEMRYDMAGGASMLGAMRAIARLKPGIAVTAFVPTVENMVSGRAQRPGDVVTTYDGKTVEVLNTDAEGRLILVDALTYAKKQGCTHVVDAATLTGAIKVALGSVNVGVFTNNSDFQARLLAAAKAEGEKMWPMPLDEEYKEQLKSAFADLANIGTRWGGAVTAAWFLRDFVGDTPWIHLDIAGCAWNGENKPHLAKGPTGVGIRTFVRLALDW
jgi:leucyl aminopeptidase